MNRVTTVDDALQIKRVLLSVSDKSDLEFFLPRLCRAAGPGLHIYSTGGTYLRAKEILAKDFPETLQTVSSYTGQPEMQGGLVKTLDYRIYLGLLSEPYNEHHQADRQRLGASLIDMVVVNLYPFRSVVSRNDTDLEDARGNIDIGGPAMLRAAAKSYLRVAAVCDPSDYESIASELESSAGRLALKSRFRLACKAFGHTAQYDRAIADYLAQTAESDLATVYTIQEGK